MKKLLILLLLLPAISFAADESESITCASMTANTWNETGGTGCALMEDASDDTYFGAAGAGDSAVYTIDDCAYAYDVIDSVVVTWRERCNNTGKQETMFMGVRVASDTTYPTAYRPLTTSFTDSTRQMAIPPSGGGFWTVTSVNAMELIFKNVNNVGGGNNFVADFTVTVWGTREAGAGPDPQIFLYYIGWSK